MDVMDARRDGLRRHLRVHIHVRSSHVGKDGRQRQWPARTHTTHRHLVPCGEHTVDDSSAEAHLPASALKGAPLATLRPGAFCYILKAYLTGGAGISTMWVSETAPKGRFDF